MAHCWRAAKRLRCDLWRRDLPQFDPYCSMGQVTTAGSMKAGKRPASSA